MKKLLSLILLVAFALSCAAFAEDGQLPIINLIGTYMDSVGQRASMTIDSCGENIADVTIVWANSASETVEWHCTGDCADDLSVSYTDCVKSIVTTAEDGTSTSETAYEGGTGRLIFNGEDGSILWQDDAEDAGKDCVFTWMPTDTAFSAAGIECGFSAAQVREALGEPASELPIDGGEELIYDHVEIAGIGMEAHFTLLDDRVRAMRFVTREGNSDIANDLSTFVLDANADGPYELSEEDVQTYAAKYAGIEDFTALTYFANYASDGTLLLYLRTSETDICLLCLDTGLQG